MLVVRSSRTWPTEERKMMKFNIAQLVHGKDGSAVLIEEVALRDYLMEYVVGDNLFGLLNWVHRDWMYSVRWGPEDPEFGFAEKSLGAKLFSLAQWTAGGFGAYRKARRVAQFPVSYEWVREHMPDAGWPWDGTDDNE